MRDGKWEMRERKVRNKLGDMRNQSEGMNEREEKWEMRNKKTIYDSRFFVNCD